MRFFAPLRVARPDRIGRGKQTEEGSDFREAARFLTYLDVVPHSNFPQCSRGQLIFAGVETKPVHVDGQTAFSAAGLTQAHSTRETDWGSPGNLVCGAPARC